MGQRSVVAIIGAAHHHRQSLAHARRECGIQLHHRGIQTKVGAGCPRVNPGQLDDVPDPSGSLDGVLKDLIEQAFSSLYSYLFDVCHEAILRPWNGSEAGAFSRNWNFGYFGMHP